MPQGSLVGAILRNALVADMTESEPDNSAKAIKYADNTTAYTPIMPTATLPTTPLQQIADDITKWSSDNQLNEA